jgi:SanA protein
VIVGFALLAVVFDVIANLYLMAAARPFTVPDVASAPVRPYAIVLGNRVDPDGTPCDELAARLETALALYRAGRVGKIVVSGMVRRHYDEPRAMAAWLRARGVAPGDVVTDGGGRRTHATMADAAALGIRAALVATQGYHLPRALYLARHAGIDAVGVPAESRQTGWASRLKLFVRESTARAETLVEVALRGVR